MIEGTSRVMEEEVLLDSVKPHESSLVHLGVIKDAFKILSCPLGQ